jgi:hypothetical protein
MSVEEMVEADFEKAISSSAPSDPPASIVR